MSILQRILDKVGGQVNEDFFRQQLVQELGSTNFDDDAADTAGFAAGQLYFFTYEAQTRQPFYDMYPLSYVIEMRSNGFLGCNLHYLRLTQREELAMSLLNNSAQGAIAVPSRTLHKYVYTGVRGQPYRIPNSEWMDVAQLPTEKFVDMRGISVPRSRIYNTN
mgnify:FL=1|tara:strand:- start:1494 stop:1982 length:489 start_codon:yes stop_codon:yes gene_type:complete